jgi:hypothetical protein
MAFELTPGKLGFKLGEVLVGLSSGTTDTPETVEISGNNLHALGRYWDPDALTYRSSTGNANGIEVWIANPSITTSSSGKEALRMAKVVAGATTTLYVGKAPPNTAEGSAAWSIFRMIKDTDTGLTNIKWADGNESYDNVWTNYASLSYS